MSFLFSGIPFSLFFLGRSIGHSVTSTRITSILSSSTSAFFPGNENVPSLIKVTRCAIKKIKTIQQNCAILLVEGKIIERRHNYVELSR